LDPIIWDGCKAGQRSLATLDEVQIPVAGQVKMKERYLLSFERISENIKTSNKIMQAGVPRHRSFIVYITNHTNGLGCLYLLVKNTTVCVKVSIYKNLELYQML
jgi:hypothetical protein